MFPKPKRKKDRKVLNEIRSQPCLACGKPSQACHIKTRGSGGDDELDNLLNLCDGHHKEQGAKGLPYMYRTYHAVQEALYEKGWVIMYGGGRERLVKK